MNVLGFDPDITVDAAWSLPSQVRRATSVAEVLKHATSSRCTCRWSRPPATWSTPTTWASMRSGAVLLNFSREGVVDDAAVLAALERKHLGWYVCDFPHAALQRPSSACSRCRTWAPPRARPRRTAR